jgi:hypothetical protein
MCVESSYGEDNEIKQNLLLPVSDDDTSVNWYIRRANQLAKNIGIGWSTKGRDYSKERAICNVQYENNVLDTWTHNKTIQKAIESYRVTDEHKSYLKSLKRK